MSLAVEPVERMVEELLRENGPMKPGRITDELADRDWLYCVMGEEREMMETTRRSISEHALNQYLNNSTFSKTPEGKWTLR